MEMEEPEEMKIDLIPVMQHPLKIRDIIIRPKRHVITDINLMKQVTNMEMVP